MDSGGCPILPRGGCGPGRGAAAAPALTPGSPSPLVGVGWQGWCRLVTAAYNYFHVTNFFWMFGEGCYLHTAIVLTYSTDWLRKWMFICIGWGERLAPCPSQAALSSLRPGQLSEAGLGWYVQRCPLPQLGSGAVGPS